MPCDNSTAEILITIDKNERLRSYQYEKISCQKSIGTGDCYRNFCLGKIIDDLSEVTFDEAKKSCLIKNREDEFLLYLEWKAVREALREYLGKEKDASSDRYKMAEIIAERDYTLLKMIIEPPAELPEIVPCGEKMLH